MQITRRLAPIALVPLLLLGAFVLSRPLPVRAVTSCTMLFNAFDADASNGGSVTPGGTSALLAYPGYTNAKTVALDMKPSSATDCAAISRSYWYGMFSLWHEAIFGRTSSWAVATTKAENWAQVDRILNATMNSSSTVFDWRNDFGPGTATPIAAAFDLSAAGSAEPTSGSTITIWGDATKCDLDQSTTKGFAPAYARRLIAAYANDTMGAWHWLSKTLTNAYSVYLPAGGSETAGGGGKGTCATMVSKHSSDTVIYDAIAPTISTLLTTAGYPGGRTKTLILDTSRVTESETALWLMSFTNSPTCTATSGLWSTWENYATSKSWDITSATYGGDGKTTDGAHTVCMRVSDRAGNLGFYKTALSIDTAAPTLVSFVSTTSSPTGLTAIPYTLTFSEPVYLVAAADFNNAGTATGCTFAVTGSGAVWTITAKNCGAPDTISTLTPRLAALSVVDAGGNAAPAAAASGTTLTVDKNGPKITTYALQTASDSGVSGSDRLTNAATLVYNLVFSKSVSGLEAVDFRNTGTASGCLISPSAASGTIFTVSVTGCGNGTVGLKLLGAGVLDAIGNPPADTAAPKVTVDRLAPAVTYTCSLVAASGFAACSPYAKAAVYMRINAIDAGLSSFAANALSAVAGFASCTLTDSLALAAANQYQTYLCASIGAYSFTGTATDRAGNGPSTGTATLLIDTVAPTLTFGCATAIDGVYATCPASSNLAQFVRISASDAGSSFGASALTVTGFSRCTFVSSQLAVGADQSYLYKCSSIRSYTFGASVTDRAGNGPISATLDLTITR